MIRRATFRRSAASGAGGRKATAAQVRFEQFTRRVKEGDGLVDVDGTQQAAGSGAVARGRAERGYHLGFIVERGSELYKELVTLQYKKTRNQSFLFWLCSAGAVASLYWFYASRRISTALLHDPYDHSLGDFNVPLPPHMRAADGADANGGAAAAKKAEAPETGAAAQPVTNAPWVGLARQQKSAIDELRESHDAYVRKRQAERDARRAA